MMLLTLGRPPPSWAAMLPQKFSAATTTSPPPPPRAAGAPGLPLRPQPDATATSASASGALRRRGSEPNIGRIRVSFGTGRLSAAGTSAPLAWAS